MTAAWDVDAEQIVPARRPRVRAQTISIKRLSKRELNRGMIERLEIEREDGVTQRPRTRADCIDGPRPCPWVGCKHSLYLDVSERSGAIKINHPHLEPDEMQESCSLDIADRGGVTLEEVGELVNMTRERVRQIELQTAERLREGPAKELLRALAGERE